MTSVAATKDKTKTTANKPTGSKKSASKGKGGIAAIFADKKRAIIASTAAILLLAVIIVGIVLGAQACGKSKGPTLGTGSPVVLPSTPVAVTEPQSYDGSLVPSTDVGESDFTYDYKTTTQVGFSGRELGTAERVKPVAELRNEGLNEYPKFGYTLSNVIGTTADKVAARNTLIAEANYLCATGTANAGGGGGYTWMDENGMLYAGTRAQPTEAIGKDGNQRQLYAHTASVGMYLGNVADDEPRIVKEVVMRPRGYNGYGVTGIYAPAGEVIKIQISAEDMDATGGITVHIGQALYNGQANNIWTAKNQMQRMPVILNTMTVNKNTAVLENGVYTAYVGSFLGGPLYIRNTNATFTATISGGVRYSHFILGYTTEEDFEFNAASSAPYFDLEVWDLGVLHSGPKGYAANFSYGDIYKAAVLWDKVANVTTTGSAQGIVFIYDPFVAAGAAVAFPGRRSVNCPAGWMTSSLNYNSIVTSGSWGNFHEYHHNFQGYGVGNGGEVTNNGMTLVSYALFTKISSKRGIEGYGAQGLGGWNNYTSATWALTDLLKIQRGETPSNGNQGLAIYATLLHNFGPDNYIKAKYQQQSKGYGQYYVGYLKAWQDITHNDMTYYFKDVLKGISAADAKEYSRPDYPMFVPVSSVYQTGRSYNYDGEKKYFRTMQPYIIPYGDDFNIDLGPYTAENGMYSSGSIVIPSGFQYRVKSITAPEHGSVSVVDNFNFTYTPDKDSLTSGQIIVTLEIIKSDGSFKVDDVDLVLEFEQSHETNKFTLERTTYTFTQENMYSDAQTAYENGYANNSSKVQGNNINPTQNCNTDIWFYPDTEANREKYPNVPESYFVHDNTIEEISGKLYFEEAGKYRIYLRGRLNCAAYFSVDGGKTYTESAFIKDTTAPKNSHLFRPSNENTYVDLTLEAESWVYFKEILIVQSSPTVSYIGLGYSKWTEPIFTMVTKYYDADGNEVDEENAVTSKTIYYDYRGVEVSEDVANNADLTPPSSSAQPSYINGYRNSYEFPSGADFETEYFYTRKYSYTYSAKADGLTDMSIVSTSGCADSYPIENMIDGNPDTYCSSPDVVNASKPWEVTVDLGKTIEANRFEIIGNLYSANKNQTPNSFTLYVGETVDSLHEVFSVENGGVSGITTAANFETSKFRYYKLVVTKTVEGRFMCIRSVTFSNNISGGNRLSLDNSAVALGGSWKTEQSQSSFGHIYVGNADSTVSFTFNGTRLGILTSAKYGDDLEVTIDGVKVNSIDLKSDDGEFKMSFLTDLMEKGNHRVVIKCTGSVGIDSIVVFD